MKNQKESQIVCVTGGAGFIGSHLCDELLAQGHRVIAFDNLANGSMANLKNAFKNSNFKFVKGDILKQNDCRRTMKNTDIIYHLACLGVRHSLHSPFENHRVNAEGTLNVLDAALKNKVKKFFYISSSEVYGDVITFPITEKALPVPTTVYGSGKLAGENYSYSYYKCFGLDTAILRIFNNYGPRAHHEGDAGEIIPRTIVNILYNKQPVIFGDGNITRDFFYVRDTAKALSGLMFFNNLTGVTMNIGTGVEITMKALTEKLLQLMNKKKLGIKYLQSRPADVQRLWVNADKFYKLTKFKLSTGFEQGLKNTIAYYENLVKKQNLISEVHEKNWENK